MGISSEVFDSTFQNLSYTAIDFQEHENPIKIHCCLFLFIISPKSGSAIRSTDSKSITITCVNTKTCKTSLGTMDDCNTVNIYNTNSFKIRQLATIDSKNSKVISNLIIDKSSGYVQEMNASLNLGDRGPLFLQFYDSINISHVIIDQCGARFMVDFVRGNNSLIEKSVVTNSSNIASDRSLILADQCTAIIRDCVLIAKSSSEKCLLTINDADIEVYDSVLIGSKSGYITVLSNETPKIPDYKLINWGYSFFLKSSLIVRLLMVVSSQIMEC